MRLVKTDEEHDRVGVSHVQDAVLLTRGPDVRIESGTLVDMVLERPIIVEHDRESRN